MVSLMSSPPNNVVTPSIGALPAMPLLMSSPTTSTTSTQQQYGASFTSPSSSLATNTPRYSVAPNPGSLTSETLNTSASALLNSILPANPPRSSLPPPSLPPPSFLSSLQKTEGPSTASVSTGAPPQTLNHQALQEQLTSLLLNMLMSQQQQMRLPLQQQQQVQAVLNSLTPSVSISNASSTAGSFSTSTSQVKTVPTKGIKSPPVTLPSTVSTVNSDVPSVLEEIPPSLVLPQISVDSVQTSDTVNELLRGLTSSDQQEQQSLKRLSEETVDVLPTFARAMMQMSSSTATSSTPPVTSTEQTGPLNEEVLLSSQQPPLLNDEGHISNDNSLMQLMNDEELVNNTFSDSSLKHIIENADFADMFSQLRDILKTPDKRSSGSASLSSREESNRTSPSSMIPPVGPQLQLENEAPHREVSGKKL